MIAHFATHKALIPLQGEHFPFKRHTGHFYLGKTKARPQLQRLELRSLLHHREQHKHSCFVWTSYSQVFLVRMASGYGLTGGEFPRCDCCVVTRDRPTTCRVS